MRLWPGLPAQVYPSAVQKSEGGSVSSLYRILVQDELAKDPKFIVDAIRRAFVESDEACLSHAFAWMRQKNSDLDLAAIFHARNEGYIREEPNGRHRITMKGADVVGYLRGNGVWLVSAASCIPLNDCQEVRVMRG